MIIEELKNEEDFTFMWIIDGVGLKLGIRNVEEMFNVIDMLFNITDLGNLMLDTLISSYY